MMLAAALFTVPLFAHAAGLGKLTVLSALGEPLNADVQIVALQPGELESLRAGLASQDAFRRAGIQFNATLLRLKFKIERRDGKPILHVTSTEPINAPFLDMLVELQWASGRLVREYTFLLDPPHYNGMQMTAAAPPAPAAVKSAAPAKPAPTPESAAPAPASPAPASAASVPESAAPAPASAAPAPASAAPKESALGPLTPLEKRALAYVAAHRGAKESQKPKPESKRKPAATYKVKKGDTLSEIARRHLGAGVTLNQMLVALLRANPHAFIHHNINLVRAGRILNIPGSETAGAVDPEEARKVVLADMHQFAEYRRKLAAAVAARPAKATPSERSAAGRITEKQTEAPPPESKDRLKLAKVEPNHPSSPASRAARSDEQLAQKQALQEAQSRVAELQKNVADLQKLLALKNQQLAALESKAGAKGATAAAAVTAAGKAAQPAAGAGRPAAVANTGTAAPQAAASSGKPAASTAPAAKPQPPAEHKPAPKPKAPVKPKVVAPPPPPPAPSLVDTFLDNPLYLAGLAAIIVLLGGYGAWAWRRKKATQVKLQEGLGGATVGPSVLGGDAPAPSVAPGVSQASVSPTGGEGSAESEEVDPIAEADVYMAYGRDAQAEEILKEARQKEPKRTAVHAKLLEIYANRRDVKEFEQTALQLKSLTGSTGAEWDKAAKLGRSIDPQNSLYGGPPSDDTLRMMHSAAQAAPSPAPTLDFDLGGTTTSGAAPSEPEPAPESGGTKQAGGDTSTLDFDLGSTSAPQTAPQEENSDFAAGGTLIMGGEEQKAASGALDFDLSTPSEGLKKGDVPAPQPAAPPQPEATATAAAGGGGGIDFDFNLDLGEEAKTAPAPSAPEPPVDLSSINLDLGEQPAGGAQPPANADPKWQEVATKLDLAKAYEEMGDKDGARELLNEALKEGDAGQQGQARQMLASLG